MRTFVDGVNSYSCDCDLRLLETDIDGDHVCENLTIALLARVYAMGNKMRLGNPTQPIDVENVRV